MAVVVKWRRVVGVVLGLKRVFVVTYVGKYCVSRIGLYIPHFPLRRPPRRPAGCCHPCVYVYI